MTIRKPHNPEKLAAREKPKDQRSDTLVALGLILAIVVLAVLVLGVVGPGEAAGLVRFS